MDKNAIKKYAVWARNELIARVTQKAEQYGIAKDEIIDVGAASVNGIVLSDAEKRQRKALIEKINEKGYDQVMEEVAYTWFNRFSALRFMEVNNYLPSRVRVFTNAEGAFKPQILSEAINLDLEGLDMEKVYALKEANDDEALFRYLIITQCNALSKVLPGMFQEIADYTELLFPDNLLREGSVIEKMVVQGNADSIPEKDWDVSVGGQVEILGWLYQYYISEKHEKVVDPLHGKVVAKDEVPAATALFTTDWVVRYIIDNSVGRYWIERNPDSKLKDELEYFVTPKDGKIPAVDEKITPEELTVFDPCMGSAHFGVYAFDVLEKIYTEYGYTEREAAASIVEKNLFGLDIDDRSAQIAYFAIMMKAMQYDKRFLKRGIQPHFYSIKESNGIDSYTVDYFANGDSGLKKDISAIVEVFKDAKEYGSILQMPTVDFDALFNRFEEIKSVSDKNMSSQAAIDQLLPLVKVAKIMSDKYAVVATNPPYLNKYDSKLKKLINDNYKDYAGDLFSVFIYRNFELCKTGGYSGFMTPFVWMFIKTYEKLRKLIITEKEITTLIQFEYSAFKEATVPICSFVLKNAKAFKKGSYFKLSLFTGGMEIQRQKTLEAIANNLCGYYYETNQTSFLSIPGNPFAYWAGEHMLSVFNECDKLGNLEMVRGGLTTGDNDRFLRIWCEVDYSKISFHTSSIDETSLQSSKWFPLAKGGDYRKWYGNMEYVVNWENDGKEIKWWVTHNPKDPNTKSWSRRLFNTECYFKKIITWSGISSSKPSMRIADNAIFGSGAKAILPKNDFEYYLGFLNSTVALSYLKMVSPTLNFESGHISSLPICKKEKTQITDWVDNCIEISRKDWDSFETSWDFKKHPLLPLEGDHNTSLRNINMCWEMECEERFNDLKANEEELNRIFIDIYGLQDELTPEEEDKDVTVRKADLGRDIRSLISYAVGCMFGRYSLDEEGLIFAGGEWDPSKYKTFSADKDGILPICDDEYFEDDITGLFIKFVETVYGADTLEENLQFIADALGGKGTPREVIRNYFLNDFFNDHCKTYQKRPIYWLFDSGKKNGFKCLIYMHRYQPDTIARIRTDYVHEQQARYRTAIEGLERQVKDASGSEHVKLNKQLTKFKAQAEEVRIYEEKIHHLADQYISIDLDDGVKVNYAKFQDVLAKIK